MVERDQAAENGFLPDRKPYAVTVLEREGSLFIRETELFCFWPELDDIGGGYSRLDRVDSNIQDIAAVLIGIDLRLRGASHGKRAVVAGAIAVIAVQYIEIRRVAGSQCAIGVDMWMGTATFAGNSIDAFDVLRTQVVQNLANQADALIFTYTRLQSAVQFIIGRVHHHASSGEQSNLILRFDQASFLHQLLSINHFDAFCLQSEKHRYFNNIHPYRLV